jgi:CheY-like chemotaxis protein
LFPSEPICRFTPVGKIIVIDDDPGMRRAAVRVLRRAGHRVSTFENGVGAIREIEKNPPDLLITDIFMPDMEGLETIRRARALWPAMPIIAMSGFSAEQGNYLEIAEKFGADAALRKPFRSNELVKLVERVLVGVREN